MRELVAHVKEGELRESLNRIICMVTLSQNSLCIHTYIPLYGAQTR